MDHHLDIFRVVFPQLVFTDLVRGEKADGTGTEKEDSLLVPIVKFVGAQHAAPLNQKRETYATLEIFAFASAEKPFSNHQCAISLPVANHTPL